MGGLKLLKFLALGLLNNNMSNKITFPKYMRALFLREPLLVTLWTKLILIEKKNIFVHTFRDI